LKVTHTEQPISFPFIRFQNKARAIMQRDKYSIHIKTIDCAHSRRSTQTSAVYIFDVISGSSSLQSCCVLHKHS
jgi:hypothetical protein